MTKLSLLASAAAVLLCVEPSSAQTQRVEDKDLPIGKVVVSNLVDLELKPDEFSLSGSRQRLQLLATGTLPNKDTADLTRFVRYQVANPKIASVNERGVVIPKANGKTKISINSGGRTAAVQITVTGMNKTEPVSFNFQTLPALSKLGCSQGARHGAPHGKGGFRLPCAPSTQSSMNTRSFTKSLVGASIRSNRLAVFCSPNRSPRFLTKADNG